MTAHYVDAFGVTTPPPTPTPHPPVSLSYGSSSSSDVVAVVVVEDERVAGADGGSAACSLSEVASSATLCTHTPVHQIN
jgi:hypothetical protein